MKLVRHKPELMRTSDHHRQVFLFLITIVVPSLVLIILTWHVIAQQRELSEKRLVDERHRITKEISQKLLVKLEDIKLNEVGAGISGIKSIGIINYKSGEVILTGLVKGEDLLLPWEVNQNTYRLFQNKTSFSEKIRRAEDEEFTHKRFDLAHTLYNECIQETQQPAEQAYAQLSHARVLAKLDNLDESLAEYHKILKVNPDITDEHDIPLCLYAAMSILEIDDSYEEVIQLINSELEAQHWLSPAESYMIQDLVNMIISSDSEFNTEQKIIETYQRRIKNYISLQEKIISLQKEFPKLALIAQWDNPKREANSVWISYGNENWLVSLAPVLTESLRLAIVVRSDNILNLIVESVPEADIILPNAQFTTNSDLGGESLGLSFPGLSLTYFTDNRTSLLGHWDLQRYFYLTALFLVLFVTLFGAYFLWRDVGRELQMAEMRSQFIASVSHELKTPLTAIRIFAETLRLGRPADSKAKADYLETIVNESHRLTRLLNNVLDFSKIEKGKRTYHKEYTPLSETVENSVQAIQYLVKQQNFNLNVQIQHELPDIKVDRDAISQAILNLLSNAIKFSSESREIELRVQKKDDLAVIEVSDQGIGIELSQQKRIFEKFYRVPSKESERIPGTGLGLALVFHTVKAHGGHVELQSLIGKGSTFSIYLPLEDK